MSRPNERKVSGGVLIFPEGTSEEVMDKAVEAFRESEAQAEREKREAEDRMKRRAGRDRQIANPGRNRS